MNWAPVVIASVGCLLLKLVGTFANSRFVDLPVVQKYVPYLPVTLLTSLTVSNTISPGQPWHTDARIVGVAAGLVALWRKLPFLAVLLIAAAVAAVAHLWWH